MDLDDDELIPPLSTTELRTSEPACGIWDAHSAMTKAERRRGAQPAEPGIAVKNIPAADADHESPVDRPA